MGLGRWLRGSLELEKGWDHTTVYITERLDVEEMQQPIALISALLINSINRVGVSGKKRRNVFGSGGYLVIGKQITQFG